MKYKWSFILISLLICLFCIASVGASDVNETIVSGENQDINDVEDVVNNQDILESTESQDDAQLDEDQNVLSAQSSFFPSYDQYSVSISDTSVTYGFGGSIHMSILPYNNTTYKYSYYLKIYDSNNNIRGSSYYYNKTPNHFEEYNIPSWLNPGNYTVKIINNADDAVMSTARLTVSKLNVTLTAPSTIYTEYDPWYHPEKIPVKINNTKNPENITLPNIIFENLTLNINGKIINKYIEKLPDGSCGTDFELENINLNPGTYNTTISYKGDEYYNSASVNVKLVVKKGSISAWVPINRVYYGEDFDFIFDKKVPLSKVSVKIDAISKRFKIYRDWISISTKGYAPKTYTATITFNGNSLYEKSVTTIKITLKKGISKITAKKKTFKQSLKTKKYSIILKNDFTNKPISKVKVTLKVNGKTYTAKTSKKGKAIFKINKLNKKGTFKATIKFKGNKYYKKATKKVKITIKGTKKTISKKTTSSSKKKTTSSSKKKTTSSSKKKTTSNIIRMGKYKAKISKSDINKLKKAQKYGYQCVISMKCINYKDIYMSIEYFPYSKNAKGNIYHLEKGFYANAWYIDGPYMGEYIYYNVYLGN